MTSQMSKQKVYDVWYVDLSTGNKMVVPILAKNSNQAVALYYERYGDDWTMEFDHVGETKNIEDQ